MASASYDYEEEGDDLAATAGAHLPPLHAIIGASGVDREHVCAFCGTRPTYECSGCHKSAYCGLHCQTNHWFAVHAGYCKGDREEEGGPKLCASVSSVKETGATFPIAGDLMTGHVLFFLDAISLAHFSMVNHTTKAMVTPKHWELLHRYEFSWLYPFKPIHRTWKDLVTSLLKAKSMARPGVTRRVAGDEEEEDEEDEDEEEQQEDGTGKIYVFGGSNTRPLPLRTAVKFWDEGPGDFRQPKKFHTAPVPRLRMGRSASSVVRDNQERLCVMGGWSGDKALTSVERYYPDLECWEHVTNLSTPRCFHAAAVDESGRIFGLGGGESIWQGARVFDSVEFMDPIAETWHSGPNMREARCGLSAAVTPRGSICVAGGYGGGQTYLSSAEYLPRDGRGWLALPPMAHPRTGFGLCYGPDGCLYAVGGSPNGSESHNSAERYDERRGVWEPLPHMVAGRSYCGASFGASGLLYVAGGQGSSTEDEDGMLLQSVECFDPRANKWTILPSSEQKGVQRVDLSLQYSLI